MLVVKYQALAKTSGSGGGWLFLESLSRAVSVASSRADSGTSKAKAAAKAAASNLACALGAVAMVELRLRPDVFSSAERDDGVDCGVEVGGGDLLRYLRACAAHLPRPDRRLSLHAQDHLTVSSSAGETAAATPEPLLGDVLVSILKAMTDGGGAGSAWHAVSAVVLHGYERRPLSALAAIAIDGVSSLAAAAAGGQRPRGIRQHRRAADDGKAVAAARALCVAATFVQAAAEAAAAGDAVDDGESSSQAEGDLVAVFPAAVLAVACEDKVWCTRGVRCWSWAGSFFCFCPALVTGGVPFACQSSIVKPGMITAASPTPFLAAALLWG